jgi:hypothetical protein
MATPLRTLVAGLARPGMNVLSWMTWVRDRPWAAGVAVFLLYTVLSVVFTWPIATEPAALSPAHIDPPFTAWRLSWIANHLLHPGHLFDGNIFWPDKRTLAYSDAVLLQGILGAPFIALGVPPMAVVNGLTIVALASSAFFAYLLAHRLTGHRGAAIVAGLVFAFSSYRRVHLNHLELQWAQWMPLAFWAWHRLLDTGRMRDGLLCALAIALQILSSLYYAMFLAIGLAVIAVVTLVSRRGRIAGPALVGLTAGAVIVAAIAAAYRVPYDYARERLGDRSVEETARYSARPRDFFTVTPDTLLYRDVLPHEGEGETELFPGVTPVLLAGAALVPPITATALAYGATLGVSADLACGPNGFLYPGLRERIKSLKALRAPGRFGILVQLTLGVLASLGLARMARRWPRAGGGLIAAACVLIVAEYATGPLDVQRLPVRPPPVYTWLATEPKLVTLELPTPPPHALPYADPFYMYASTWHWQPLVNGYSGHYSRRYLDVVEMMPRLPDDASVEELTRRGVQRILVHEGLFPPGRYPPLIMKLEGHPMFHLENVSEDHLGEVRVYAFLPGFGPQARK